MDRIGTGQGPDMAWQALEELARDPALARKGPDLAGMVRQAIQELRDGDRTDTLAGLTRTAAQTGTGLRLLAILALMSDLPARHLALELAGRLPVTLDPALLPVLLPLLAERWLPVDLRVAVAARLIQTVGPDDPHVPDILRHLIAEAGRSRAVERLGRLAQLVGSVPAIAVLQGELASQIKMRCPRCQTRLPREEMLRHLWQEHHLVLDGKRVREPWRLIEDWIVDYDVHGDADLLGRCLDLGRQLDPREGPLRVQRMFLAHGIEDVEAHRFLRSEAQRRGASLCPACYALIPARDERPCPPLSVGPCRLSSPGYGVDIDERGLISWLRITGPKGRLHHGPEPGYLFTSRGAAVFLAGPLALVAVGLAFLVERVQVLAALPVTGILGLALAAYLGFSIRWWLRRPAQRRAIDHAWTQVVPLLHGDGFSQEDSRFLAGLARVSLPHARTLPDLPALTRALERTDQAVSQGAGPAGDLAALWRLRAELAVQGEEDTVLLIAQQVGRCLEGKLPLVFAEHLLAEWEASWWTKGNLARLRVLLCDRAFQAGLEVHDLAELARTAPALGDVLAARDREGLARLRLLWSQRAAQPWDRCGAARTVFDLAPNPRQASKYFGAYPDLLLVQTSIKDGGENLLASPLVLCGRGIVFEETLFEEPPEVMEVKAKWLIQGGGFDLILGEHRFYYPEDPDRLARRLERWFRFWFHEFLPQVAAVHSWRSPVPIAHLRLGELVTCPDCRQRFLAELGNVGAPLEAVELPVPMRIPSGGRGGDTSKEKKKTQIPKGP